MSKPTPVYQIPQIESDPFGMITFGRSWQVGSDYRYGFNRQEQDDDLYGNGEANTAEFWEYDTRIGRRWNLDIVANPSISAYACLNDNPIYLIDVKGDKVDPNSQAEWDKNKKATDHRINILQKELAHIQKSQNLSEAQKNRVSYIEQALIELNDAKAEIKSMEEDQTLTYHLQEVPVTDPDLVASHALGVTKGIGNDIYIKYSSGPGVRAHELKHGYQFLTGDVISGNYCDDVFDELNAFKRGYAYDEATYNFSSYNAITYSWVYSGYKDVVSALPLNKNTNVQEVIMLTKASSINVDLLKNALTKQYIDLIRLYQEPNSWGGLELNLGDAIKQAYSDTYNRSIGDCLGIK